MSISLLPEDIGGNLKSVSLSLNNQDIAKSLDEKIRIKYNMIDTDITRYNFSDLDSDESSKYFKLMRSIANVSINDLINSKDFHKWHLHSSPTYSKTNLRKEIDKIVEDDAKWDKDNLTIYHIALDPDCNNTADRTKDIRNQRIYFLVGANGEIHILFFDRYHELNPEPQNAASESQSSSPKRSPLLKNAKKLLS